MYRNGKILVGKSGDKELNLLLNMTNRHGIITGATGSGKTITAKVLAESFSNAGVPVFISDVKGDLSGTALTGTNSESMVSRLEKLKISDFEFANYPVRFWDVYGENGHPIRAKIEDIGSEILSIMLGLSEAQEGNLTIVFRIAQDENLELSDLSDLKSVLQYVADHRQDYITKYGNITTQSIGVIQRSLLMLENQGADKFFGEPSLEIRDFISFDAETGKGAVNILHAVELFKHPDLYASFMLWLLTDLYNTLPEVGDVDKPKIVFFFDEAHLLFNGMPLYRLKQITQIVKLIRSKGIGLFFISQLPTDIPDEIASQLGNKIQHTLRAYTPQEQKVVKIVADSFRENPNFDTKDAILELGTGEALISFQTEEGIPEIVEKATILPPQSMMGEIDESSRMKVINNSPYAGKYDEKIDNESAHEIITKQYEEETKQKEEIAKAKIEEKEAKEKAKLDAALEREKAKKEREEEKARKSSLSYQLGKKVTNKATNKIIDKGLNKILKGLFK